MISIGWGCDAVSDLAKTETATATAEGVAFAAALRAQRAAEARAEPAESGAGRPSIAEQVSNRILAMIRSGNLKAGDKLPTEAQMCLAFGISRPPLREALKALSLMGVLESRQGGRYLVTDLSPSRLVTPFNLLMSVAPDDIMVQFEARAVVELELVRFCTERASEAQRARIMALAEDGWAFRADPVGFRLLDAEYHQAINLGADNAILSTVSEGLYNVAIDARRVASATPGVIDISVAQHCAVAEAIAGRRAEAAVAAYRTHLDHVRDTTVRALTQMPE